jgi:cell division transport system ATP-binding protein
LRIVGLARLADRYPSELSGGEQQRTAIARAIVGEPELLIADEPTGNLDPLISWEIMELLMDINRLGVTVLVATHDSDIVTTLRRRVIGLEGGRLIRDEANATYHRVG